MEHYYKINEVAELFGIPVSTLHYWEKEGLFHIRRNTENNYRCFTLSDVLNIWEILLYRDLDIPVQSIKELLVRDRKNLKDVYTQSSQQLELQMKALEKKMDRIKQQQKMIAMADQLEQNWIEDRVILSDPDWSYAYQDDFSMQSIQHTLEQPYDCGVMIGKDRKLVRCIMTSKEDNAEKHRKLLWTNPAVQNCEQDREENCTQNKAQSCTQNSIQSNSQIGSMEFLLKFELDQPEHNNLDMIYDKILKMGYLPGIVVARYLLVTTEQEKRIEMHRAWITLESAGR